jgi:predicted permease
MRQLKLAFRTLFRTPFVTTVAILSLALGIGANAAIYSLFDQMLLRPLPVHDPAQLVDLSAPGPKPGSTSCNQAGSCEDVFSLPMFRDLQEKQEVFSGLAGHVMFGANISFRDQPMTAGGVQVSGSYFPTLGVQPALGRLLGPDDDRVIGGHYVAVLAYSFWEAKLGSDPGVLNQQIIINGKSMTIVGVAPRGFEGTTIGARPQVFVPLSMRGEMQPIRRRDMERRQSYWLYVFGRLKPGVSIEQASASINALYKPIINDVEAPLQEGMSDPTMVAFKNKSVLVTPGARGQSSMHEEAKTPLAMLFGITGVVLLIACGNIANLLLARGANRSMEMAVRLALGASRRQLLAQLLTESVLLAFMGGMASLLVAKWTLGAISSMLPPDAAESFNFVLQPSVLLFAAGMSVATGLLFGMFPALHSTRPDLVTIIRANTGQLGGHRAATRFRATLVTAQIALSMALLVSAGLFIKSLMNVSRVDIGVKVDNVVTFGISPVRNGYDSTRSQALFERVEEELAAIPGVTGVTSSIVPLLANSNWGTDVRVQGFQSGPDIDSNSRYNEVSAGYFSMLGIPLIAGREFTRADAAGAGKVAIVNETFAKKFNMGQDVVGKFMSLGDNDGELDVQIVGYVRDAKYSDVKDTIPPVFVTPWRQDSRLGDLNFYVRSSLAPEQLLLTIPAVMRQIDPTLPLEELKTMPQQIRENIFLDRMISTLSASFALLATLLASVGLYGVLAYTVAQRTREIGVRMALGADKSRVRRMVLRQVAWMVGIGGVIGIAAALGLGRAARSLLYGLEGNDPYVFAAAVVVLGLVALAAGYVPARRASQVDPMQALRYE